jgi:hypothetical protein
VGTMCEEAGRRVNVGLLRFVRAHYFASSVLTPQGYKSEQRPLHTLTPSHIISRCLLVFFLVPEERERERKKEREKERDFGALESVASPSPSMHGRTRLDPFQGHTGAPAEPCDLPHARGPCVPPR